MNLIAAVDKNWAIGNNNKLLNSIPEDMEYFKKKTMNKTVIMGKNTLLSFPGGKPLKKRENIVITLEKEFEAEGAIVVNSVEAAVEAAEGRKPEDIYVIGGASIYSQMLCYCDTAYITKMDYVFKADTYFPDLDQMEEWELGEESVELNHDKISYRFCKYIRRKKDE